MRWIRLALAFAVVATIYFYRLDRPLLWDDEADTGVIARNVLHTGSASAFDGRNVSLYDGGTQLNRQLLSKKIPWVQYYVGAASLALFGDDTQGLRVLFALAGLLAFFPLWAVLSGRVKQPEIVAALALIAPQTALFQRNARYYSLLILLYACLVWHLSRDFKNKKLRFAAALGIFILFFHTHPFAALCAAVSLGAYCLLWRRPDLPLYGGAAALGFLSWLMWYGLLGPALTPSPLFQLGVSFSNFGAWSQVFFRSLAGTVIDLDAVDSLPLLLLCGVVGFLFVRGRSKLSALWRQPLFGFVLLGIAVQVVATSAVFGTEAGPKFAILRYMPHLAVFATVATLVALDAALSATLPFLALSAIAVGCNLTSLSYWTKPFGREVPPSWTTPVYSELFNPHPQAWDQAIATLRNSPASPGRDHTVVVMPAWTQAILIFYVGDRYLVPPDSVIQESLGAPATEADSYVAQIMGRTRYNRLEARPEWLVDSLDFLDRTPRGFVATADVPSYQMRPDDGTRPELTRHTFLQSKPVAHIAEYHERGP